MCLYQCIIHSCVSLAIAVSLSEVLKGIYPSKLLMWRPFVFTTKRVSRQHLFSQKKNFHFLCTPNQWKIYTHNFRTTYKLAINYIIPLLYRYWHKWCCSVTINLKKISQHDFKNQFLGIEKSYYYLKICSAISVYQSLEHQLWQDLLYYPALVYCMY